MDRPRLTLREPTEDEIRFVRSSWFKSYQKAGAPEVGFDLYLEGQHRLIDALMAQSKVIVVTLTSVPQEVCAWVCFNGSLLHYAYTKQAYRHLGIQKQVLAELGPFVQHSHETKAGRGLARLLGSRWNPYLLMKGS